jgi:hypothetical protein
MDYTGKLKALLAEGRRGDAAALAMTTFGAPAEAIVASRQSPVWPSFESVAPTLAYDSAIMRDGAVPAEWVASIHVSTLVMDGGASPAFLRGAARAAADVLPNAQHRTLESQTHDVTPEALAPVLVAFFKK